MKEKTTHSGIMISILYIDIDPVSSVVLVPSARLLKKTDSIHEIIG